jgi:hypothetical protein
LVDRVACELGYRLVFWNVDTMDWLKEFKGGGWVEHALTQVRAREDSTLLAHDIHPTTVGKVEELNTGVISDGTGARVA